MDLFSENCTRYTHQQTFMMELQLFLQVDSILKVEEGESLNEKID